MENTTGVRITKRDYEFAIAAGLLIGLLLLPVLKTAKPELFQTFAIAIVPFFLLATPLGLRIAFLFGKKIAIIYQIAKFGVIGVSNVLVDLGVLALVSILFVTQFKISANDAMIGTITFYSLFKAISFIVANINSYFWNKYWTFDKGKGKQTKSEFIQFFGVSVIGFIINVVVASIAFKMLVGSKTDIPQTLIAQYTQLGAIAGSIIGLAWNFVGYKLWVFKK